MKKQITVLSLLALLAACGQGGTSGDCPAGLTAEEAAVTCGGTTTGDDGTGGMPGDDGGTGEEPDSPSGPVGGGGGSGGGSGSGGGGCVTTQTPGHITIVCDGDTIVDQDISYSATYVPVVTVDGIGVAPEYASVFGQFSDVVYGDGTRFVIAVVTLQGDGGAEGVGSSALEVSLPIPSMTPANVTTFTGTLIDGLMTKQLDVSLLDGDDKITLLDAATNLPIQADEQANATRFITVVVTYQIQ